MSLIYGLFDSIIEGYDSEGLPIFDRAVDSDFLAKLYVSLIGSGILLDDSDAFKVLASNKLNLNIKTSIGSAFVDGRFLYDKDKQDTSITLRTPDSVYDRIDVVVIRSDKQLRTISIQKIDGNPTTNPKAPEILRNNDIFDIKLAEVYVAKGTLEIINDNITDFRSDKQDAGAVYSMKQYLNLLDGFQNQIDDIVHVPNAEIDEIFVQNGG